MKREADSTRAPLRRLAIFEGNMGSDKSTSTRWLGQHLATRGMDVSILTERQYPHPLRATDFAAEWFKPWLDMTADDLVSRRLKLWETFVESALTSQTVHIVDGQLFHDDLTNMFLMNMLPTDIARNVQALAEVIRPPRPLLSSTTSQT